MKKLILLASLALLICGCSKEYDDSALNNRINSLEQRLSAMETVMRAYQNNLYIKSVQKTDDGYIITFSDGSTATITNGKDGRDGKDGTNGKDGSDGKDGQNGADGKDGKDGENGKDGDTLIESIVVTDTEVTFILTDGRTFSIPIGEQSQFAIEFETTDVAVLEGGQSTTISYTITGATDNTIVKTLSQDGWKAQVNATSTSAGTITITAPDPIVDSEILVLVNDGSYRTLMVTLNCYIKFVVSTADDSVSLSSDGGTQQIKIATNADYVVDIPENAKDWISVAETRAMRDETLTFTIAPNTGLSRFATVVLRDPQNNPLQTLVFKQLGVANEIYVDKKGDLEKVLADYDYAKMESLKISGVLNDVDFLFIYRMMPNLKNLDISEVNITALPQQAFYNSTNVENLILPNTLSVIGKEMFYNSVLKEVYISKDVETIEGSAFYQCSSLTSIEIPASVETIGASAFKGCSKLTIVTFEKGSQLKTIKSYAFESCKSLSSIEIPASVETIEKSAFKGCSSLATVTFEKGSQLKTIGGEYYSYNSTYYYGGAFSDCPITSIEIPASVETIETAAFKGCSKLATVTFEKGSQLKTIKGGYYSYNSTYYYHGAFSDCPITSIEIPASVETIETAAFKGCSKLTTVTFEKGSQLKTIKGGYYSYSYNSTYYHGAFSDCPITSIEIPASVETIETAAFKGCSKLATVTFEKGSKLKMIEGETSSYHGAFSDCPITSIEIPASVETIGAAAFKGCSKLAIVTFEKGSQLKTIGGGYYSSYYGYYGDYGAFSNCSSLTSIEIPASVETIKAAAFKGCSNLASVTFEKGSQLKTIEGYYFSSYSSSCSYGAFCELKNLMTVDMSECTQVKSIGESAFDGDKELRLFMIGTETPPICERFAFSGINPYSVLKVPSGCANAYKTKDGWSNFASITGLDE